VTEVVIATHNAGKAREIADIMAGIPVTFVSLADYPGIAQIEEHGSTFEDNACAKARGYAGMLGLPCLADDSGLEVDALAGAPGIRSARFAGTQGDDAANNRKLIDELAEVPDGQRSARFVCVAALAFPDGHVHTTRGECRGSILHTPRGTKGFGYDPLFLPDGYGISFAEMDSADKNIISHRAVAMRMIRRYIEAALEVPSMRKTPRVLDVDFMAPQPEHVAEAANCIIAGRTVALRTDTLYGLMADATRNETVRRVYELKQRPAGKPLPVLAADLDMAERVAWIDKRGREAMNRLWPGPVTAVFNARDGLADGVCGSEQSVALRVPSAALPRDVIAGAGVPVTGTSANRSGHAGARDADQVIVAFGSGLDLVLDSGSVGDIKASTLLDLRCWPPALLRAGAAEVDSIENTLGCRIR